MSDNSIDYPRGAEWRIWDFHVHTPASFHWSGKCFADMADEEKDASIDKMIDAMNKAKPSVFVLMDYWTFDGWLALQERVEKKDAPKLIKEVFPGIELRINAPTKVRLNAHVVFSNETPNQDLSDFKAKLMVELANRVLSDSALIKLAREDIGSDKLKSVGVTKNEVDSNEAIALEAGSKIAEINVDSYKKAIKEFPNGNAVGFMAWNTSGGLLNADWDKFYSFVIDLMRTTSIFETRSDEQWPTISGIRTPDNAKYFNDFQKALGHKHCLAVAGSDAHKFTDFGKFPSGKATWIKADPTFWGLLQAIKEPARRSFIGAKPDKLGEVEQNSSYFIKNLQITKSTENPIDEKWMDGCDLPLNHDLVAIIGNKGSGKSALADVIALLGGTKQTANFSFLEKNRFRSKHNDYASHFTGYLNWLDPKMDQSQCLAENLGSTAPELIQYIPQNHFETLCNEHILGSSNAFENELRDVIFSRIGQAAKQGASSFEQLIDRQEQYYRDQLAEHRKDLGKLNVEIELIESKLQSDVREELENLLKLAQNRINKHKGILPQEAIKPKDELTNAQKKVSKRLDEITTELKEIDTHEQISAEKEIDFVAKENAIQTIRKRLQLFEGQYKQFKEDTRTELQTLSISIGDVLVFETKDHDLLQIEKSIQTEKKALSDKHKQDMAKRKKLTKEQLELNKKLNQPQKEYEEYRKAVAAWEKRQKELVGSPTKPDSLEGIKARIKQIQELPSKLDKKCKRQTKLTGLIFDVLGEQRQAREQLYEAVQEIIDGNDLIHSEYKLKFKASLAGSSESLAEKLFERIKLKKGGFKTETIGYETIRRLVEPLDLNIREDVLKLVEQLHNEIVKAGKDEEIGISTRMKKGFTPRNVYDLLYGLSFLEPRYTLLFQDTEMRQLSPGQRGALLLIFYLIVDDSQRPVILDQPEENLDNQTVYELLVPVLSDAKKRRQIIMVTHNPNLAVVCDAEQIIYCSFNRKKGYEIKYVSGSVENPDMNRHVIDVLEGTKPAFNNRKIKYQ